MNQLNKRVTERHPTGFTLLEILIALFIFSILSLVLAGGLRSVINAQAGAEKSAERLRQLQMALLILSRDVEQTVNRPIMDAAGKEELAFIGSPHSFTFTHAGFANPTGAVLRSTLQRTQYTANDNALWRTTWNALDQAPTAPSHSRRLLAEVTDLRFQYLDKDGRFYDDWPLEKQSQQQPLPRAVRVSLSISSWGTMSQLYVISAEASKTSAAPGAPPPPPKS